MEANYQWVIGSLLFPFLLYILSLKGKRVRYDMRAVGAFEKYVEDTIENRRWWRNVLIGVGAIFGLYKLSEKITFQQKAELSAEIVTRNGNDRLRINNIGDEKARNIKLYADGVELNNHTLGVKNSPSITELNPNSYAHYWIVLHKDIKWPVHLHIDWLDPDGVSHSADQELIP